MEAQVITFADYAQRKTPKGQFQLEQAEARVLKPMWTNATYQSGFHHGGKFNNVSGQCEVTIDAFTARPRRMVVHFDHGSIAKGQEQGGRNHFVLTSEETDESGRMQPTNGGYQLHLAGKNVFQGTWQEQGVAGAIMIHLQHEIDESGVYGIAHAATPEAEHYALPTTQGLNLRAPPALAEIPEEEELGDLTAQTHDLLHQLSMKHQGSQEAPLGNLWEIHHVADAHAFSLPAQVRAGNTWLSKLHEGLLDLGYEYQGEDQEDGTHAYQHPQGHAIVHGPGDSDFSKWDLTHYGPFEEREGDPSLKPSIWGKVLKGAVKGVGHGALILKHGMQQKTAADAINAFINDPARQRLSKW
jgi:hypothetical protein